MIVPDVEALAPESTPVAEGPAFNSGAPDAVRPDSPSPAIEQPVSEEGAPAAAIAPGMRKLLQV